LLLIWGSGIFSVQYFSLLLLRFCTDFQRDVYPGMGKKSLLVGGGNMGI
jgi:hypothetical protein